MNAFIKLLVVEYKLTMNIKRSFFKNKKNNIITSIIVLILSQVIVKVFGLLYKLYLANKTGFGDAGNAIYNSGYQIYALLLTISSIGVPNAVSKIIAENKGDSYGLAESLKSALILFSFVGLFGSALLAILSGYISEKLLSIPEAKSSIIALSPAIFNVCLISVFRGYFNGINNISISAKSQTIEQILKTVFTIVLVEIAYIITCSNTTYMAAFANLATTIATLGSLLYLYKKNNFKKIKTKCNLSKMLKILFIAIPISLSSILASLNRNIDSVTVVRLLKQYIGEYNAKIEYGILSGKIDVISAVPVSFIIAIATTIIPEIAEKKRTKKYNELTKLVENYLKYTIFIILPCCVCLVTFSKEILNLLFNSDKGSILLQISAIAMVFISLEQIVNSVLQGNGKVFVPAIALTIGVCVKIILNIKLLNMSPKQYWFAGVVGCSIATLSCHIIAFFISFWTMKKSLKIKLNFFNFLLKAVCASCIMAVTLNYAYFLLKRIIIEKIAIIISGLIAAIIYIISALVLRIIDTKSIFCIKVSNKTKK